MWSSLRRAGWRIASLGAVELQRCSRTATAAPPILSTWRAATEGTIHDRKWPTIPPAARRFFASSAANPSRRKRIKRHKTSRTPLRKKRAKAMQGTSRRLMPASSIYKNRPKLPKGFRKLSHQEVEHEKFKVLLTRTQMRQCAWTNEEESRNRPVNAAPELRRAATSWNDFDSVQTVKKIDKPPIKMKKRPKKVTVSTVVSFTGKEAGRIASGGKKQRRLLARTAAATAGSAAAAAAGGSRIRRRKPSQLPPSDKRIDPEKRKVAAEKTKKKSSSGA